ncbi:MAG: hypothetical protein LBQ98_07385 [Nitrososphaerota archaeon]|jgi:hypothetical protein|nr:hypothetical protein [Nitrososphaerota archaeon]
MTASHTFKLRYIHPKNLLPATLLILLLSFTLFVYPPSVTVEAASLTDAVHVKTETELRTAIADAPSEEPIIIAIDNDIPLTETLNISVDLSLTLMSNSEGETFSKLIGPANKATITIADGGTLNLEGIIVTHSAEAQGLGIDIKSGGTLTMTRGKISGNTAGLAGGVHNDGTFTMAGGEISANTASTSVGGAVYNTRDGHFSLSGGVISGNTANFEGGGICNYGVFSMTGGVISKNTADNGGGVYNNGDFSFSGGEISGNTAKKGGGIYNYFYGRLTITGKATISNNKATVSGGGIVADSPISMAGGTISGNTAEDNGGGVYVGAGSFELRGGKISSNTALKNGGGIFVENLQKLSVATGVEFSNNRAATIYDQDSTYDEIYRARIAANIIWTSPLTYGYNNYDIGFTKDAVSTPTPSPSPSPSSFPPTIAPVITPTPTPTSSTSDPFTVPIEVVVFLVILLCLGFVAVILYLRKKGTAK